jgi:hypothetical protein
MKGIMRKKLLGLLSVVGLASSSTPVSTQVLKGSQPADTKAESTVKASKTTKENAASKDAAKMTKVANERKAGVIQADDKRKLSSVEGGHATSDVITEKQRKAGGEQAAAGGQIQDKHTLTKISSENAAATAEHKDKKSAAEKNASQKATWVKGGKVAAGANAAQSEAGKKADQASPK